MQTAQDEDVELIHPAIAKYRGLKIVIDTVKVLQKDHC